MSLQSNPHEELWDDLIVHNCIQAPRMNPSSSESKIVDHIKELYNESALRKHEVEELHKKFREALRNCQSESEKEMLNMKFLLRANIADFANIASEFITGSKFQESEREKLMKNLGLAIDGTLSGLTKLESPDVSFKPLEEYLEPHDKHQKITEVNQFNINAMENVIILSEER